MLDWLKNQSWYWKLYYVHGFRPAWLPAPEMRQWNILLLEGMEPPPEMPGYRQRIVRMPAHLGQLSPEFAPAHLQVGTGRLLS